MSMFQTLKLGPGRHDRRAGDRGNSDPALRRRSAGAAARPVHRAGPARWAAGACGTGDRRRGPALHDRHDRLGIWRSPVPIYIVLATILLLLILGAVTRRPEETAVSATRWSALRPRAAGPRRGRGAADGARPPASPATPTSCSTPISAARKIVSGVHAGIHAEVGLSCHDCHGGNPDPALADDMTAAMSETFASNPVSRCARTAQTSRHSAGDAIPPPISCGATSRTPGWTSSRSTGPAGTVRR